MRQRTPTRLWPRAAAWILAAGLSPGAALAEGDLLEDLRVGVKAIQGQIAASSHKLKKGMAGARSGAGGTEAPGRACCFSHIDIIKERSGEVSRVLEQIHGHYTETANSVALDETEFMIAVLHRIDAGTLAFERAPSADLANQALLGLIRPFNDLQDAVLRLIECCPIEDVGDGKKGQKKKKKKSADDGL